ncbi:MAG: hypothetical protein GX051_00155 [Clostridiales bacterium]|nr:hypothetical protein [Clostridiales bacterium]
MSDIQNAKSMDGTLYRIFRCFGREFPVYYQYSDEDNNAIPDYPDFEVKPQYTDDGMPFALASQAGCEYFEPDTAGDALANECGCCKYFRTEADFSLFGICTNNKQRLQTEKSIL